MSVNVNNILACHVLETAPNAGPGIALHCVRMLSVHDAGDEGQRAPTNHDRRDQDE